MNGGSCMSKDCFARLAPIEEWSKFHRPAKKYQKKKWIFRGHRSKLPLESSLDLAVRYYRSELSEKHEAEKRILREFQRRYHQYSSDAPKDNDYLEWFSIMQHYGAPTRLLDFTYSPYVAAHFALEHVDPKKYTGKQLFEIFAINIDWAMKKSAQEHPNSKKAGDFFGSLINNTDEDRRNFESYFMSKTPKNFACPFNPFRLTERITLQRGVFMCPGNVNSTFKDNLTALKDHDKKDNIVKFILKFDKDQIIKARENLYDLNITHATLFPGLEGFAKSLAMYPPK